jgi:uncharacterized protein DUF5302
MADKAAGPESSGDMASQAESGDGADQHDEATAARDDTLPRFREALERKRARDAGPGGGQPGKDAGKIHGAHGPAGHRRSFRRKSG